MKKIKIKLVQLGKQQHEDVFEKLKNYKSSIFEVEIYRKNLPECDYEWGYRFHTLKELLNAENNSDYDMCIGFIDTIIENNYFGKRLDEYKTYIISFYEVDEILQKENIDIFNYILLTMYKYITRYKLRISGEKLVHDETRGCIFDMCGDKRNVIYSCNKPIICNECRSKIYKYDCDEEYIKNLEKELKKIKKTVYYRISDFIKKEPILSLIIGIVSSIVLNLVSCAIYDFIKLVLGIDK
ncbi:hypothetical protein [uncultured Clostridium sp.]|uniref:hypothetical protein n=1 Tax=uncultured Clostridium sp. TaxID=59620 RepID=UPI0025D31775|nr:hypothetical protein [uncultured Clostridium sp.]